MHNVLGLFFCVWQAPYPAAGDFSLSGSSWCFPNLFFSQLFLSPRAVSYTQWLFCVAFSARHPPLPSACSHTVSSKEPDPCLSSPIFDSWTKEIGAPTLSLPHISRHLPVCLITLRHLWWKCPLIIFSVSFTECALQMQEQHTVHDCWILGCLSHSIQCMTAGSGS